ncbi:MAG: response regulator [Oceanospirillaceae bacterium]|nr:response regulator [Oceanospirillaceae bacterium]
MDQQDYSINSVLLVDDEKAILNALKRLLMPLKCKIYCAESGAEALAILADTDIDIIISDMRMPEMSGEQLLAQVAIRWPNTERVVLTGFSDSDSIINAINNGSISRFLQKPWDDKEVKKTVEKSFLLKYLTLQNQQLEALKIKRSKELIELNHALEEKVTQRTEQLKQSNDELQESYRAIVKMFSSLIDSRLPMLSNNAQLSFNKILATVADQNSISGIEYKQLLFAWQLRHIGKLSFSDELLTTPYLLLSALQQRDFQLHPLNSLVVCLGVKPLYPSGKLIYQHREYLDGSGYPKGLHAQEIDIRAQIITVLNDYIELTSGLYKKNDMSSIQAINYMLNDVAHRYNRDIVISLQNAIPKIAKEQSLVFDQLVTTGELRNGMILSRDLFNNEHCLLLSAGQKINELLIQRIHEIEQNLPGNIDIYVNS